MQTGIGITESRLAAIKKSLENVDAHALVAIPDWDGQHFASQTRDTYEGCIYLFSVPLEGGTEAFIYECVGKETEGSQ